MVGFVAGVLFGVVFCVCWMSLLTFPALAADHVVTDNGDSGAGTLRQAILEVIDDDTISFNLASGSETIIISSELSITESLTINDANAAGSSTAVTVQCEEGSSLLLTS